MKLKNYPKIYKKKKIMTNIYINILLVAILQIFNISFFILYVISKRYLLFKKIKPYITFYCFLLFYFLLNIAIFLTIVLKFETAMNEKIPSICVFSINLFLLCIEILCYFLWIKKYNNKILDVKKILDYDFNKLFSKLQIENKDKIKKKLLHKNSRLYNNFNFLNNSININQFEKYEIIQKIINFNYSNNNIFFFLQNKIVYKLTLLLYINLKEKLHIK